jgi:penicillin-insensitive murein endopeptidase
MSRAGHVGLILLTMATLVGVLGLDAVGQHRRPGSVSIGEPNEGKLLRGARLPQRGRGFYSNPKRPNAGAVYGTDETISVLTLAGADVDRQAPGATLYINDISLPEGGSIPHHGSHRVGRDADLLFFAFDGAGAVAEPVCIPFDAGGKAVWDRGTPRDPSDDEPRVFDVRRNWLVVRSLVEDPDGNVQRIYVAEHIRTLLLSHAREAGAPAWTIERAGDLMCEPGPPHDDHFHVRLFCTAEDYRLGCRDKWPLYPWRRTELARVGLTDPRLVVPEKRRSRGPVRRPAGPPSKSPGRFWCP